VLFAVSVKSLAVGCQSTNRVTAVCLLSEFDCPAHASIWGKGYPDLVISCDDGQTLVNPTGPMYTVFEGLLSELSTTFTHGFVHIGAFV
jgi:hypothetical protein